MGTRAEPSSNRGHALRVAVYTRVSTPKLKDAGADGSRDFKQNPALQVEACERFCAARGWDIVARFTDRMSGSKDTRPDLERLMLGAHQHAFDCVVVWKWDRFARSALHMLQALQRFGDQGIQFVSATEPMVDTTTAMGKAMFTIGAAFAELERSLIAERVKAGMASAKARGIVLGRKRVPVPVLLARQDIEAGSSIAATARKYGLSRATLHRALAGRVQNDPVPAPDDPRENGGGRAAHAPVH